ncbi:protein O-mannosyl-transferase family [Bacteroidota bacterium]
MDFKLVNRITGLVVFLFASIVYVITVQPTLSFWDCGEFIASAYTLSVPHPPGAPFFMLVGRFFTLLPIAADIGLRMNYLSVFSSSLSVMLLYLISTKIIKNWRGYPKTTFDIILICGASAIGALAYAFSDTFWFNALETEVYGFGTFLIALNVYLLMVWWEKADEPGSDKYLLMVAYIVGLSIGIHLLVVQCIIIAGLLFYFRRYEYSQKTFILAIIISSIAFFIVYPGVVKKLPLLISGSSILVVFILLIIIFGIYYSVKNKSATLNLFFLSLFLILLGYSTYISVFQRANVDNLPMNENRPDNIETLISYLNREQYGQQPLFLPRRYSQEPQHERTRQLYSSDMEFLWKYQINEMFNRYLFWQFIGREGYDQGDGVDFSKLYAIPFILGMFGVFYHFRKDWKLALVFLAMFLLMGIVTTLYQNQQDPQPRERDYFYVGAYMVFSLWIGLGAVGIIEQLKEKMKKSSLIPATSIVLAVCFLIVPMNMLRVNYPQLSRQDNYFPFNYAYNILQSVEKDAIVITNGDNDTFPVWALQAVYGVRTDVRIVNLSLGQTDWYNLQLKNERPYGAKTVPMTYSDDQLRRLQPVQWDENKLVSINVPVSAYPDSMRNNQDLPDKIIFNIPATIRQQQGNQVLTALKTNDLLVLDIIRANNWERPIYFSVTVSEDNYIGLGDYLLWEGMAQRLVPYKTTSPYGVTVNNEIMRECLFNEPSEPRKTMQYGFIFKGLDDKSIFYNQDHRRMIETYRTLFLRLAYSYSEDSTKYDQVKLTLDEMEKRIPRSAVPMDYRIKYDVAMIYLRLGDVNKFNEYAREVETVALEELQTNPGSMQSYYNPYRILIDIYEAQGQYQKALDILNRLSLVSPNDPAVQQKMAIIKQKMMSGQ